MFPTSIFAGGAEGKGGRRGAVGGYGIGSIWAVILYCRCNEKITIWGILWALLTSWAYVFWHWYKKTYSSCKVMKRDPLPCVSLVGPVGPLGPTDPDQP